MKMFDDVIAIEPHPLVYLRDIDLLVVSDLHLGFELVSAEHGIFIPRTQFKNIKRIIEDGRKKSNASRILILGDIKHEFSETGYHEYREVYLLLEYLKRCFEEIIAIKGNHDTFITRITRKLDIEVYDEYREGKYLFLHGHKDKNLRNIKEDIIILGHEHPSVALFTDLGIKEKIKIFLYGNFGDKKIIVMPAASYFAEGSDINILPSEELISPILRRVDIDGFRALGIIEDDRYLPLPEIRRLRKYG